MTKTTISIIIIFLEVLVSVIGTVDPSLFTVVLGVDIALIVDSKTSAAGYAHTDG